MADKKTDISPRNDDLTMPDDDKRKEENGAHEHKEGPLVDTTARVLARIRPLKMLWPGQAPDDGKTSASPGGAIEDPRRIVRQGLLIVFLFFGVLGVWATFGEISGAVVGVGTIKVETERKTVQHLEGGIVDAILVKEGDEVKEGQVLIELTSVQVDASEKMLQKQLVALQASRERALAEKNFSEELHWSDELRSLAESTGSADVLDNEYKIFLARKDNLRGQISLLESQLAQLGAQISGFEDQLKAETTIIRTLEEELGAKRQLYKERYLEKSQILELERTLASHRGERGRLRQAIAEARQRSDELRLRIEDLRNRFVEEAASNIGKLENDIVQTSERIRPLRDAQQRLQVTAPVSGKVVGLKVHSRGGVVRAGEPLMDIVPHDTPLIIEMQVPINKITEVHVGQDAYVQLDAFDTRIIPHMPGKVVYISADRLEDKTSAGAMPYYLCHVVVDPEPLKEYGLYLTPGMPATVFIATKKRTVLFYMFEPLIKSWDRALRE
ncbi:HlyD family type I secretion periplasmic adaptor subunit [uncultured Desulfovibrio sp.]|uniref:HlyD family type I secretion periplasmic adaptor subunit n=1 Tax=uncultured Desulfovibrio sp. TaxID=167968 RepID=UPI002614218B|nr:HlyD family type I secretion periplasmic adaptor subunit [uncultured Desulfovibrio sp.]